MWTKLKARMHRIAEWWRRNKFDVAKKAMSTFVIIGLPFSMLTAWKFYLAGMLGMAILWFVWASITAAVPLYVAANSQERA